MMMLDFVVFLLMALVVVWQRANEEEGTWGTGIGNGDNNTVTIMQQSIYTLCMMLRCVHCEVRVMQLCNYVREI